MEAPQEPKLLLSELKVINIGARMFYDNLKDQGVPTVHVNWRPPAGGQKDLLDLLEKLDT